MLKTISVPKKSVNSFESTENAFEDDTLESLENTTSSMPDDVARTRYPSHFRRPPPEWYVPSASTSMGWNEKITTNDDLSLKEVVSASPEDVMK